MSKEYPFTEKITPVVNKYKKSDGTDDQSAVRDILTDLLHFCEKNNLDFNKLVEHAMEVFDQEVDSEE